MKFSFILYLFGFVLTACSDRPAREPFPGPPGRTADFQQAQATQAVLGGTDSFGARMESQNRSAKSISGRALLSAGSKPQEGSILFISIRPKGQEAGPPLAVKRESMARFPYPFMLTEDNVMIPGTPFEGEVDLTVRLDVDGNPVTKDPGDLSGTITTKVGARDVEVLLK